MEGSEIDSLRYGPDTQAVTLCWPRDLPLAERIWRVGMLIGASLVAVGATLALAGDPAALNSLVAAGSCVVATGVLTALFVERRARRQSRR